MRAFLHSTLTFLAFIGASHAEVRLKQLYQFTKPTDWVENIAVRSNGHLLLTTYNDASLYSLDPEAQNAVPQLIAQLPHATVLTGIAEIGPDVFAFAGGDFNMTDFSFEDSSGQVALINLNGCQKHGSVSIKTVAKVPAAKLLNGLVALPERPGTVLSSDSKTGTIYRVDTLTSHVDVVFQDERLTPNSDPKQIPLGVNGLKIYKSYLYMTNSARQFFARVKINSAGDRVGDLEIIQLLSNSQLVPDDLAISKDGTAFIAAHPDAIAIVTPQGKLSTLVASGKPGQSNVTLITPTSVALGRDENTLFVVTGGSAKAGGLGGQVVAISF
ncbi:hypothetical protein N7474_010305 [Penicillium riverlandense]|uniref:uncharacterized protein n=1 Tax=Penicillium riverlandense TaxID=1903569 RepID=UPI002546CE06|nr:uncharacterized protein N7474_010305 [Penicillium riverlandense]KAJ5806713.1 hypothetical protein N7474_010305 [Penicillium riverlandense]